MNIQKEDKKRKPLDDITNTISHSNAEDQKRWAKFEENHWLPLVPIKDVDVVPGLPSQFNP